MYGIEEKYKLFFLPADNKNRWQFFFFTFSGGLNMAIMAKFCDEYFLWFYSPGWPIYADADAKARRHFNPFAWAFLSNCILSHASQDMIFHCHVFCVWRNKQSNVFLSTTQDGKSIKTSRLAYEWMQYLQEIIVIAKFFHQKQMGQIQHS